MKQWSLVLQPLHHFTYVTAHSPTLLLLYLSFSNPSASLPISQLILQPFCSFTYVTWRAAHDPLMMFKVYLCIFCNVQWLRPAGLYERCKLALEPKRLKTPVIDETWARSYKSNLKHHSNEWKHPGSCRPKKVRPTQCAVKFMFIVQYDNDGMMLHHAVPPRQTVNAAYYCMFLQHHLCPVLRRKLQHLVVWKPIILQTMQGVTLLLPSWTSCAVSNGIFCNIHLTHLIWVHAITISSPKWKNHCEEPGTTQEINLSML